MFKALLLLPLVASIISICSAAPASGFTRVAKTGYSFQKRVTHGNAITKDGPLSVNETALNAVPLNCPYEYQKGQKALLMVHGTASTGNDSFSQGLGISFHQANFYVCYPNLPNRSLADAQISSEYVVHFIKKLYAQMGNQTISVLGHSQGNLDIQWALNFFPSTRDMVDDFVSVAGDFHGTAEGSNYLAALNKYGNMALVDTTSIYTYYDDIIQPELPPNPESVLPGASNIALQELCGPLHLAEHFSIIIDGAAYAIAIDALTHPGPADMARIKADNATAVACLPLSIAPGITLLNLPALLEAAVYDILSLSTNNLLTQSVRVEPALKVYAANQPYNG